MEQMDRVRFLTQLFASLVGLRLVPIGVFALVAAANDAHMLPRGMHVLGLPPALLLSWLLHRYYERSFGVVERACAPKFLPTIKALALAFLFVLFAEKFWSLPVSPAGILFAALVVTVVFLAFPRPFQAYYSIAAALILIALLLLPQVTGVSVNRPIFKLGGDLCNLFVGLVLIFGGIADHILLVRSFEQARVTRHA